MTFPKISVNIPIIVDGSANVVLKSLRYVKYPKKQIEIIIVEGNHIAEQRNKALYISSGEIIYLLDNDSQVNPDAFKIIAEEFKDPTLAAVGGPSLTPDVGGNYINRLIGYALETYFGAMRMRYRYSKQQKKDQKANEYKLIGANLALRRSAVLSINGFDKNIVPNEETELLRRLQKHGHKLKYNEKLFVFRYQRNSIVSLAKQFSYYGTGRMKQILKSHKLEDSIFLIPIIFFFYFFSLIFYRAYWYLLPLFIYIFLGFLTSLKASIKYKKFDIFLTLLFIFPIIHFSYAFGLIHEIIKQIILQYYPKRNLNPNLKVTFISSLDKLNK